MEKEELLEEKLEGIIIIDCENGDMALLCPNGTVERGSHEAPEAIKPCPSLAQFFIDCIELALLWL